MTPALASKEVENDRRKTYRPLRNMLFRVQGGLKSH